MKRARQGDRAASNRVDRTLTAVSVVAGLALVGAFIAGLLSAPAAPGGPADDVPSARPPEGRSAAPSAAPAPDSARPPAGPPLVDPARFEGSARVEILNGAGRAGFARDATTRLRALGHDVVLFGNADRFDYATSVVLDRGGPAGAARAVADALGIDEVRVEPDPDLALDATVILGADWRLPPPPTEPAAGLGGLLRRLLGPP